MSTVKLGGKLPKDNDQNGLDDPSVFRHFLTDPRSPVMVVALLQTSKIVKDIDNYDTVPQITIRAIEVVQGDDHGTLRAMLQRIHAERTGALELPAEWEEILSSMASPALPGTEPGR
ncbi:hypothetical protein [Blastococcus sp. CT_GayMR16]|uniref:hypothetical protein n=1 Tax=Blastococcus sp. CT_GayMR16 TaxID=2559607 RepID=UPI001073DBA8|nr:hypothetical protein [Blastococcus sp. CT_GayMR16]TFV90433.1 hypothetical protein E4P38_03065 [Blastococcus sp. CT_GayMR16]